MPFFSRRIADKLVTTAFTIGIVFLGGYAAPVYLWGFRRLPIYFPRLLLPLLGFYAGARGLEGIIGSALLLVDLWPHMRGLYAFLGVLLDLLED